MKNFAIFMVVVGVIMFLSGGFVIMGNVLGLVMGAVFLGSGFTGCLLACVVYVLVEIRDRLASRASSGDSQVATGETSPSDKYFNKPR